jgi:hypothetical protein
MSESGGLLYIALGRERRREDIYVVFYAFWRLVDELRTQMS